MNHMQWRPTVRPLIYICQPRHIHICLFATTNTHFIPKHWYVWVLGGLHWQLKLAVSSCRLPPPSNTIKQIVLGSDLWVRKSVLNWVLFRRLFWCDPGWWRYSMSTEEAKRANRFFVYFALWYSRISNQGEWKMSGFLKWKRGKGAGWKKNWFVLKDRVLFTFKAVNDKVATDTRPVLGWTLETLSDVSFPNNNKNTKISD